MRRQFCLTHTVRYDESNCDGVLTPAAFLRYMQDIAARDAEDARLEGDGYWVIKRTVISFAAHIPIHARLELKTYGIGFTRITAQRGYEAHLASAPQDEPLISARTLWVYVDPHGRPMRLPERTAQIWLPDGVLAPQPEQPFPCGLSFSSEPLPSILTLPTYWLKPFNEGPTDICSTIVSYAPTQAVCKSRVHSGSKRASVSTRVAPTIA